MKPNPNLDELLSSFIDGELSPRQRTEVQRMAAHDPAVARRLQQLQNCRTLFGSLPPAEAPGDLLEQIKLSLERTTLLQEQPAVARRSAGTVHLVFRKFVAAAAMIALLAVLGAVVYQVVAPVTVLDIPPVATDTNPGESAPVDMGGPAPPMVVADAGFSGSLELQTTAFVATDAFVKRAINTCGLVNLAGDQMASDRRIYRVVSTREGVNRLVASLGDVWEKLGSASLQVNRPDDTAAAVTIEAVTPNQVATVVASTSTDASIKAARAFALMNHMARNMPGGELPPLIPEDSASLWAMDVIPMPKLTGPEDSNQATHTPAQGLAQASLTIVLLRTTK